MDFYSIGTKETKGGVLEVFPDFSVGRSKDLMVPCSIVLRDLGRGSKLVVHR